MKIKITFTEPLLGTLSGNKELAETYIAGKCPNGTKADELEVIENIDEELEKSSTVFNSDEKGVFLWDYQIKGFFKDSILAIITSGEYTKEHLKKYRLTEYLYKKTIDQHVFINPRKIYLELSGELFWVERPLRADTMRGARIALARSQAAPAGTTCDIEVSSMQDKLWDYLTKCLDYGKLRGIGQWRNSGMGRFVWEEVQ